MEDFKTRIKQAMEVLNKSQVDIVNGAGVSKGALSNYIHGRYEPKQDNIYKIAKYLNVNEAWLMGYDDIPMMKNIELSVNEALMIKDFRQLNDQEKKMVNDLITTFLTNKKQGGT